MSYRSLHLYNFTATRTPNIYQAIVNGRDIEILHSDSKITYTEINPHQAISLSTSPDVVKEITRQIYAKIALHTANDPKPAQMHTNEQGDQLNLDLEAYTTLKHLTQGVFIETAIEHLRVSGCIVEMKDNHIHVQAREQYPPQVYKLPDEFLQSFARYEYLLSALMRDLGLKVRMMIDDATQETTFRVFFDLDIINDIIVIDHGTTAVIAMEKALDHVTNKTSECYGKCLKRLSTLKHLGLEEFIKNSYL